MFPILSDGIYGAAATAQYIVSLLIIPFVIIGLCLLFPRLSLASYTAQEKVSQICVTLNSATASLVRGFCAADYADLYSAEVWSILVCVFLLCFLFLFLFFLLIFVFFIVDFTFTMLLFFVVFVYFFILFYFSLYIFLFFFYSVLLCIGGSFSSTIIERSR